MPADFREKSGSKGTLDIAKSAALNGYLEADEDDSDFEGVDLFSEEEEGDADTGGGVSILLDVEEDEDFGGFISMVLRASCCNFMSEGERYMLLAASVLLASGSGIPGYLF